MCVCFWGLYSCLQRHNRTSPIVMQILGHISDSTLGPKGGTFRPTCSGDLTGNDQFPAFVQESIIVSFAWSTAIRKLSAALGSLLLSLFMLLVIALSIATISQCFKTGVEEMLKSCSSMAQVISFKLARTEEVQWAWQDIMDVLTEVGFNPLQLEPWDFLVHVPCWLNTTLHTM